MSPGCHSRERGYIEIPVYPVTNRMVYFFGPGRLLGIAFI